MIERRRRRTAIEIGAITAGALVALGIPAWLFGESFLKHRAANIQLAREWSIDGTPCPTVSAADFAKRRLKAPKGLRFADIEVFRQYGHLSCSVIKDHGGAGQDDYAVCQFTAPNTLRVKTVKGEWLFAPGVGQPATVATPNGIAHCVLAAKFKP